MLVLLRQGRSVSGMKRTGSDISIVERTFSYYSEADKALFKKINWVEGDVCDVPSLDKAFENVETVYHCAGYVSLDERDREKVFAINGGGTANVVNVCLEKNIKALCHVSSIATLSNSDISENIDENVLWKPSGEESSYATSKYVAEQEVWRGIEEGLQAVIVNPGVILGPGKWNEGSCKIFSECYKGLRYYTTGVSGYIAVMDVAEIMIRLTEQKKFGERFILVENNYSLRSIIEKINAQFKMPAPTRELSRFFLNAGRFFGFLLPGIPRISKPMIKSALTKNSYSNKKILDYLGFKFTVLDDCISFSCRAFASGKNK